MMTPCRSGFCPLSTPDGATSFSLSALHLQHLIALIVPLEGHALLPLEIERASQDSPFAVAVRLLLSQPGAAYARLQRLMFSAQLKVDGRYAFNLYSALHASWCSVQIDDMLPCVAMTGELVPWHARTPARLDAPRCSQMWLPLLHKASGTRPPEWSPPTQTSKHSISCLHPERLDH